MQAHKRLVNDFFQRFFMGDRTLETAPQALKVSDTDLQLSGFILAIGVEFPRLRCRCEENSRAVSLFEKVVHFLLDPSIHRTDQKGRIPEGKCMAKIYRTEGNPHLQEKCEAPTVRLGGITTVASFHSIAHYGLLGLPLVVPCFPEDG